MHQRASAFQPFDKRRSVSLQVHEGVDHQHQGGYAEDDACDAGGGAAAEEAADGEADAKEQEQDGAEQVPV
ncbi:MAG TPA: hypothetical protein ENN42_08135 [Thioalkalivibrio sp.]|nr:hypothetical protein [Thioalkalivibrio sp.]